MQTNTRLFFVDPTFKGLNRIITQELFWQFMYLFSPCRQRS